MTIYVPVRYPNITAEQIHDVLIKLGIQETNILIERVKRDGRYINFTHQGTKHYVCFANDPESGRNAFLIQYFGTAFEDYVSDASTDKAMAVYFPMHFKPGTSIASYHQFVNRIIHTLGVTFLNETEAFNGFTTSGFSNLDELLAIRNKHQKANSANKSSHIVQEGNRIAVYGKLYGANAKESSTIAAVVRRLTHLPVTYYPVTEQSTKIIPKKTEQVLTKLGIHIAQPITLHLDPTVAKDIADNSPRKTARFHFNLLEKFGPKTCYMCDCSIESAIIGAHIHRVKDIADGDESFEDKVHHATTADNGLWLCATHDKLYEYGIVYYDESYSVVIAPELPLEQQNYISRLTSKTSFLETHRNDQTQHYLSLHRDRVQALK